MKGFSCFFVAAACLFFMPSSSYGSPEKPILYESQPLEVSAPNEQRDERFSHLLSFSLKIHVAGASGSGTICHYDESSGFAHVISCGHLWSGNMEYDPRPTNRPKAKVITWYKNSVKLREPETFEAEVLFWSNEIGYDVSLLRFKPDWVPGFAPIEDVLPMTRGLSLNSVGCDGGGEVARYEVLFEGIRDSDIITSKNSPRPGRSGGGLITDSGKLVGVCWGTSDTISGNGTGYFTPVSSIKRVFERNDHGWLTKLMPFRFMPIIDHDNAGLAHDKDFVPYPNIF